MKLLKSQIVQYHSLRPPEMFWRWAVLQQAGPVGTGETQVRSKAQQVKTQPADLFDKIQLDSCISQILDVKSSEEL